MNNDDIRIRAATTADAAAIAAIYNQGIAEGRATFETRLRQPGEIAASIADSARHPVIVAVDAADVPLGWGSLSAYRPRDCYAGIAEVSVYLDGAARGRGLGRVLLDALVAQARMRGYWKLVSRVFTFNAASRAICRASGFREVGIYEKHGRLDGQWLDVVIVERLITENLTADAPHPSTGTADAAPPSKEFDHA